MSSSELSIYAIFIAVTASAVNLQHWSVNISSSNEQHFEYYWNKCVGSGHASLSLRADWQQQLKYVHDQIGFTSVRFHGILDDDVGVVNGINDYSFINIDKIYDYILSIDMKPYVEISFMPQYFASNSLCTTEHYKGIITPPNDWNIWYDFIKQWIQHLVTRYGIDEILKWKFEVWNEPNVGHFYATTDCKPENVNNYTMYLYNYTINAIKSVDQRISVGGPATGGLTWITDFLQLVEQNNYSLDFLSSHSYPGNTKNDINWYYNTLNKVNNEINQFDKYKNLSFILSEFNSGIFQWNEGYDNHDTVFASSFMIAMAFRLQDLLTINNKQNHYQYMSYWTFSDIFEENGFQSPPFWNNYQITNRYFGIITKRNIPKPIFRSFQLLAKYGSNVSYNVDLLNSTNGFNKNDPKQTVTVFALKNTENNSLNRYSIFISNFANLNSSIETESLQIDVIQNNGGTIPKSAYLYRIDENNSNAFGQWIFMGKPSYPTIDQLNELNKSSELIQQKITVKTINAETVSINLNIPPYGVAMIDLQY